MKIISIDLAQPHFWWMLLIGVVVLTPIVRVRLRQLAWAGVNTLMLALLLHKYALIVLMMLLGIYFVLQVMQRSRKQATRLALGAVLAALVLFAIHKLPGLGADAASTWGHDAAGAPQHPRIHQLLAAVGYSYLFLRIVEVVRAVWEQRRKAPDFFVLLNYTLPFHMLASGPIQSYDEFADQPDVPPTLRAQDMIVGAQRIAEGLFKKFVIAETIRSVFLTGFYADGWYWIIEVQLYYLWFYLDFSAYSDIAVGCGRLMGVATPENFNRPYLARNMIDFWERWHISLSHWIRRNLFIPIQLSLVRKTEGRRPLLAGTIAFTIAFLLCGLWHGVSWTFFGWGAMHALGLVVVNAYRYWLNRRLGKQGVKQYLDKWYWRWLGRVITYEWVALSLAMIGAPWSEL